MTGSPPSDMSDSALALGERPLIEKGNSDNSDQRRVGATFPQLIALLLAVVGVVAAWFSRDVLILAFAGVLLGVFFRRIARRIHDLVGIRMGVSLAIAVVLLFGGFGLLFWLRGSAIGSEFAQLRDEVPRAADALKARLQERQWGRTIVEAMPSFEELVPDARSAISRATGVVSRGFDVLTSFAVILFLGIAFAATPGPYVAGILAMVPRAKVPRAREVLQRVEQTLWWWMLGGIVSMSVVGVATGIGLWLLGIPLALTLAVIAALLTFIPNIGPILAAVPALLLALAQGYNMALYVVLLYSGVQAVETYVLGPVVDRNTVALPPALTVIAQLLLVLVGGIIGAAIAAPLAAMCIVVVTMLYVHDVLGRRDVSVPGGA